MERLLSWEVVGFVVALFVGVAFAFVGLSDFKLAKLSFLIAAADALGGIAMWGFKTQRPTGQVAALAFLAFGCIGALTVLALRYVDGKADKVQENSQMTGKVLLVVWEPVFFRVYGHPALSLERISGAIYLTLLNETAIPIYVQNYSVDAYFDSEWHRLDSPTALGFDPTEICAVRPNHQAIQRVDLSANGFDYLMRNRPLYSNVPLDSWMFFNSSISQDQVRSIKEYKIVITDASGKQFTVHSLPPPADNKFEAGQFKVLTRRTVVRKGSGTRIKQHRMLNLCIQDL